MIWQSESDGTVKDFAYDASGNRIGFRLTRGGVTELDLVYNYDQLNRVTEVGRNNTTFVKYAYDANGNRTMNQYPASNIYTGYEYNQANLVVTVDNYIGSDQPSYFYYTYTLDGNQIYKSTMDSGYDYSYDHMGRLIEENYNDGSTYTYTYTYDRFSNRASLLAEYDDDYETVYTYDLNNRLLSEVKTEGGAETTTTYTYDANGNQLTKVTVDGTETRGYNGLGQLISVSGNDTPATYAYRPDGLRYSKTTGGVTHAQLWDGQNVVAEVGATGVVNTRYLRGVNLVAREIDGALQYYQFDAHGDVLHRIDASGNVLKTYVYDAFGVETDPEPLDTNPFRYCGEYFDRETQTYYLRARNYDPRAGRFTTEDAARSGLNWYTYCSGNPLAFRDPFGEKEIPGNWTTDDWMFFDSATGLFNGNPQSFTQSQIDQLTSGFGQATIGAHQSDASALNQLHIVDRIARILFHEDQDSQGQAAITWLMFNRTLDTTGFTANGADSTLYNVVTARGQFDVFAPEYINDASSSPMKFISQGGKRASWDNCVRLAKILVSITGNPFLSDKGKREFFEKNVPNPFPDVFEGQSVDPFRITFYASDKVKKGEISVKNGNTANRFRYQYKRGAFGN